MTKLKNTKKGMAKKALSVSLVAAMLATSNVPVWAAEDLFSDGSAAVEAPAAEVETFGSEPAEEVSASTSLSSVVTESDLSLNLQVNGNNTATVVWGDTATMTGTITKSDGTALKSWSYRWLDENGISQKNDNAEDVADMTLTPTAAMAGKTLTLYIYKNVAGTADFDVNTGITVTVEKRSIDKINVTDPGLKYNGFSQSAAEAVINSVTDSKGESVTNTTATNYTVTSTSAVNAGDTVTVTVTAAANSPYVGSVSQNFTIGKKDYENDDIIASTEEGQSYQYTGDNIKIPVDKVSLKESQSTNNGVDGNLNGNDLSSAIKSAVTGATVGYHTVDVIADIDKLTNFTGFNDGEDVYKTKEKVTITKRNLSTSGTKISVIDGKIKTDTKVNDLSGFLKFAGTEATELNLSYNTDYTITVKDPQGNSVDELSQTGTYTVTITATSTGSCTGSQTFDVETVGNVLQDVEASEIENNNYAPVYTGSEIRPTQSDLGTLTVDGTAGSETLQSSEWRITGYTNNTEAATYNGAIESGSIKTQAYVNISILDGKYRGETIALPFVIKPLEVKNTDITIPAKINYNENYTKPEQYNVPVTVVAKDASGKVSKTLTEDDYTVKYEFVNGTGSATNTGKNEIYDEIKVTVTIKNTNYIAGTGNDGKTRTVEAASKTQIVAKQLTDSMVIVNPSTYTYTGGEINPSYVVMDGQIVLYKEGEVTTGAEYKEVGVTDAVEVGTGRITVEGLDPYYSGQASATFAITPANTQDVKVEIDDQQYTGRQIRPRMSDVSITLNGNDVKDQFEIASYGENVEAGKGTVVLKVKDGNKNFTGSSITAEFNIVNELVSGTLKVYNDKGIELADKSQTFTFDGNAKTFAKVLLEGLTKVGNGKTTATADDFEIKYADNVTGNDNDQENGKNTAYIYAVAKDGTGFSGNDSIRTADGTVIKGIVAKYEFYIDSVEFVKQNVTVKNGTYAGGLPVKPEILIQIGGSTLVEGTDYTVSIAGGTTYTDVTNGKIYDVTITGINGYSGSTVSLTDSWGIDKKDLADCDVTVTDGVVSVTNGYIPVPATEYTSKNNGDGTYTITANTDSKNYTGSKTVTAEGQAEDEKPDAPMIQEVRVSGNNATVVLSGESEGATGYDYVISTDRDCINNKDYDKVNKNILSTETTFTYTQQGVYYAYCHAWKRVDGEKVFSDWSEAYPFVVSAITPEQPVITSVKKSGRNLTVTWTQSENATTGYDVVMGTAMRKVNGEMRPVEYGKAVKKVGPNTFSVTFKSIPKGTYYVGLHAHNRTSESGVKVFSPWSNAKKVTF